MGGTGEVRSQRGVGGSEKELPTSLMEALAKMDRSELARKFALPDLRSQVHLAAKVGPWISLWEAFISAWLLHLRVHRLAAGGVPGTTVD